MCAPAARRMIVPGPARGRVDLKADAAAQALPRGDSNCDGCFWHFRFLSPSSLRVGTGGRHRPALDESLRLDVGSMTPFLSDFLPRSECDEAIHSSLVALWIASLRSQ